MEYLNRLFKADKFSIPASDFGLASASMPRVIPISRRRTFWKYTRRTVGLMTLKGCASSNTHDGVLRRIMARNVHSTVTVHGFWVDSDFSCHQGPNFQHLISAKKSIEKDFKK